jgi:hypothetical protein
MQYTVKINATGEVEQRSIGAYKFVMIRSATAAFQLSFDGVTWRNAGANDRFPLSKSYDAIYFKALNANAATVTFEAAKQAFTTQDTAQSNRPTAAQGNLGIANNTAAANGLPQCDGNGYLYITNSMALNVAGTNDTGNRRQIIIFSVAANSPAALQVMDANGNGFMTIPAGTVIPLVTDSTFILSGAGGTAYVTIGQMFLSQQG